MADSAFQTQFRQEFVQGFEQRHSLLRDSVTTETQMQGNQCVFLVADSGDANAVTRGLDGLIPSRSDNLNQYTATLKEWHDKPRRTGFNLFASQGDGRRIMQETAMAVINRRIDQDIINELANATQDTGATKIATLKLVTRIKVILGNNKVKMSGVTALVTPAFMGYLSMLPEFSNAQWVEKKPLDSGEYNWEDNPGYYKWAGLRWIEHPELPGVGTNAEKCFFYHKSAIGHAAPADLIQTAAGYDEEDDYSYARCTAYMGPKILQNSGIVVVTHDGSEFVSE